MGAGPAEVGKKWFMRQYWRLQQSQSLISMGFWCVTLTLLIWPYVSWRFDANTAWLGIPATYIGLASIALMVLVTVLLIGYIYDQFLSLWKEHQNVIIERNPFATYLLTPRDAIIIGQLSEMMRTMHPDDERIQAQAEWMEKWLASMPELEVFERMVTELDVRLGMPVPEFTFLPDGAVEAARQSAASRSNGEEGA